MASTARINSSKMGAADLCDGCLVVLLDDSIDEFYEGKMENNNDMPTLRHVNEEQYREPDYFDYANYVDEDEDEDEDEGEGEDEEGEEEDENEEENDNEDEDDSEGDFSPGTHEFFVAGVSPRRWRDELPGLPAMAETADAGCQLCRFLRQVILRKDVAFEGPIQVEAGRNSYVVAYGEEATAHAIGRI
ncbi:hypothetical protein Neosp_001318 [[Neocosmospora] mangrovei]